MGGGCGRFSGLSILIFFLHPPQKRKSFTGSTHRSHLDSGSNWRERRRIIIVVIDFYRLRTANAYFNNTLPTCSVIFHAVQLARCTLRYRVRYGQAPSQNSARANRKKNHIYYYCKLKHVFLIGVVCGDRRESTSGYLSIYYYYY